MGHLRFSKAILSGEGSNSYEVSEKLKAEKEDFVRKNVSQWNESDFKNVRVENNRFYFDGFSPNTDLGIYVSDFRKGKVRVFLKDGKGDRLMSLAGVRCER